MKQSKLFRTAIGLTLALGMAGCAVKQAPSIQLTSASKLGAAVKLSGTLRLTIHWPNRNYNTNFLPDSTTRIVVNVKKGTEIKATGQANRTGTESTMTTSIMIPADTGYDIEVFGYRADGMLVARGAASGVTVNAGFVTRPSITMTAETAPRILSVKNADGASVAKAGSEITLKGDNFGNEASLSLEVSLGALVIPSGAITREGTDSIKITVPAEAKSGWVKIKVDGSESETSNPLWIINSLSLPATASMLNGADLTLTPSIGWVLNGTDTASTFGTPPNPSYAVNPLGQGVVAANTFTANASSGTPGNVIVNLMASMAGLNSASMAITVRPVVNSVAIAQPATNSINATDAATDSVSASYVSTVDLNATVAGDAFNQGVNWSSGNAALATVDSNGLVTANNTGTAGSVTITATSKDDTGKSAQVTITVTNYGSAEFEVN